MIGAITISITLKRSSERPFQLFQGKVITF